MAATSAPLGVNFDQQGPNFGPSWTHLAPTSAQLGSKMAQLGPKLDPFGIWLQNGGHSRPNPKSSNTRFRCYFPTCQVRFVRFYVSLPASFLPFLLPSSAPRRTSTASSTVSAGIIERKLRSTKVRLFTVPCCSIILFSSEGMKKMYIYIYIWIYSFFRRSIILVGALLFYNSVFPHFSHISHFRSIINFLRSIIRFSVERKNYL